MHVPNILPVIYTQQLAETLASVGPFHSLTLRLVSIHVLAWHTMALDVSWCMGTNDHKQSSLHNKSLRARNKGRTCWTFAREYEGCAAICCDCDLWEPITQDTKDFLSFEKRARLKTKDITTIFGKSLFLTRYRMRYAIQLSLDTKDLAMNLTTVTYRNRQNAKAFTQANNSDWLRALKDLMETRL